MADDSPVTTQQIRDFFYAEKVTPGRTGENPDAYSVFDLEYIPTSKAADFNALTSGYFTINDFGQDAVKKLGFNAFADRKSSTGEADGTFWQIIVTHLSEEHEETYALHNTIADNVAVFSTGARPVAITIKGYVLVSGSEDYNYLLLRNYVDHFRARHLSANSASLTFRSQDTGFRLVIESLSLSHTIEFETYVEATFSGLAYDYGLTGSFEPLDLSYYGRYRKTPASRREEEEAKKEEEEKKRQEASENSEAAETSKKPYDPPPNTNNDPRPFMGPPKP